MTEEPHPNYEEAMSQLFTAKWNIPQAAVALSKAANKKEWGEVKETFREYCKSHPPTYVK
jgi:hypothetical protein